MNKKLLLTVICVFLFAFSSHSAISPNEEKIYFHLHQATRWAEVHHSKKYLFSKNEMGKHLGKIKYSEINLFKSKFYSEYVFLKNLAHNLEGIIYIEIELFREKIRLKAEVLKIEHPNNWKDEFTLVGI